MKKAWCSKCTNLPIMHCKSSCWNTTPQISTSELSGTLKHGSTSIYRTYLTTHLPMYLQMLTSFTGTAAIYLPIRGRGRQSCPKDCWWHQLLSEQKSLICTSDFYSSSRVSFGCGLKTHPVPCSSTSNGTKIQWQRMNECGAAFGILATLWDT